MKVLLDTWFVCELCGVVSEPLRIAYENASTGLCMTSHPRPHALIPGYGYPVDEPWNWVIDAPTGKPRRTTVRDDGTILTYTNDSTAPIREYCVCRGCAYKLLAPP